MSSTLPGFASTFVAGGGLAQQLADVRAAVTAHMHDTSDDRDARLYGRVLGPPDGDLRADDPNDWPEV